MKARETDRTGQKDSTAAIQHKLLAQALDKFKKDRNVRAIFVAGSLARGDANTYSDVDLVVIVKKPRQYVRYFYKEVHIEVDSMMLARLVPRLKKNPVDYYSLIGIKPLHDPSSLYPKILQQLRRFRVKYRASTLAKADLYIQLFHYRAKFQATSRLNHPSRAEALSLVAAIKCFEALAHINNAIVPPLKEFALVAKDFKARPKNIDRLLARMVRGNADQRIEACSIMIDFLLPKLAPSIKKFPKFYQAWH